jgi:MHS family proline/betaine transporter-like MFS transporter
MREVPKTKVLTFASIGNCLELYDFTLYGIMLPFLANRFFPAENHHISLLIGYLSFALTFLIAPIGSIFWGWYGDKFGRVAMLRLSLISMAIPSLGIALLPTYDIIGLCAPLLLIILRIIQGLSASGEVIGAKIFAMEILGKNNFGLCSGVISAAGAFGVLAAIAMAYAATQLSDYPDFWRLPFLIGSLLFLVARCLRQSIAAPVSQKTQDVKIGDIASILAQHKRPSLVVFILGAMLGIFSYFLHAFINPFLIGQGFDSALIYRYSIYGLLSTAFFSLLTGKILDHYHKLVAFNYTILMLIAVSAFPLFALLLKGGKLMLLSYLLLNGLLGMYACASAIIMYRSFPVSSRCRGMMFNYAIGCALFGGITPIFLQGLSHIDLYLPGLILSSVALSCLLILRRGLGNASLF